MREIALVTVTYGDRAHLCIASLRAAAQQGVTQFVVVLNGVTDASSLAIRDFSANNRGQVAIVDNDRNVGTAIAFGRGIQVACETFSVDYIWLLDDDNVPRDTCLATLWKTIDRSGPDTAVAAMRPALPEHVRASHNGTANSYPSQSSFLYFDGMQRIHQRVRPEVQHSSGPFPIPYGPYGGLLFPASVLEKAGLPRADFVLYEDDTEFTSRMVMSGTTLLLDPLAVIDDIDQKWTTTTEGGRRGPGRLVSTRSPVRLYYATRNRVFFDFQRPGGNIWLRRLNATLYIITLCLSCRRVDDLHGLRIILTAMFHGVGGKLGCNPKFDITSLRAT